MGFAYVASGPLVRSSYKAAEVFVRSMLLARRAKDGARGDADAGDAGDPRAEVDAILAARLADAESGAAAASASASHDRQGARAMTLSELAARSAASLLPASALVRRGA